MSGGHRQTSLYIVEMLPLSLPLAEIFSLSVPDDVLDVEICVIILNADRFHCRNQHCALKINACTIHPCQRCCNIPITLPKSATTVHDMHDHTSTYYLPLVGRIMDKLMIRLHSKLTSCSETLTNFPNRTCMARTLAWRVGLWWVLEFACVAQLHDDKIKTESCEHAR